MSKTQEIVIRRYADNTYGIGEPVIAGVTLFRSGMYNLDKEQLETELKKIKKAVIVK